MPSASATRTIAAAPEAVWDVVGDPHHLPRWWPRVTRVEGVDGDAFTEVLTGRKGKVVRADFTVVESLPQQRMVWEQEVEGTPFEGVLRSAVTRIELKPAADRAGWGTEVRIELRQEMPAPLGGGGGGAFGVRIHGISRFGSPLVKRAAAATVKQALDGLARALGDGD
ncbi:MAG: SRPBCC family protein [Solirubrobacteraceae bacterium]